MLSGALPSNWSSAAAAAKMGSHGVSVRKVMPSGSSPPASSASELTSGCRRANRTAWFTPQLPPAAPTRALFTPGWARRNS